MSRHFQHNINTKTISDMQNLFHRINFCRIQYVICAHLHRNIQALMVGLNSKDGTGARDTAETYSPQTNRSASKNRHGLVCDIACKRSMHSIAEWLLNRGYRVINLFTCLPGNLLRNRDVLRECSIAINTQNLNITTDMRLSRPALVTLAAGNMRLRCDEITGHK